MSLAMYPDLAFVVVLVAALIATVTDVKERIIYRRLTAPLFIGGLFYSGISFCPYFAYIKFGKKGLYVVWCILQSWLGPVLIVAALMVFLFWLGVLGGGDGHFMIAVAPWLGFSKMVQLFGYLFPLFAIYLGIYLLYAYKFNLKFLLTDQLLNLTVIFKNFRTSGRNISFAIPNKKIEQPPAMVAVLIALILTCIPW